MGIFDPLYESAQRRELLLVEGGICHYHLRRDGQLTIREIISTKPGAGSKMLRRLMAVKGAKSLYAKCPAQLEANLWYSRHGFHVDKMERTKSGRNLICWRMDLETQPYRANVGTLEVVYCADGNPRFAEIAIDSGMLYGARLPSSFAFRPYFADQDWKAPDRAKYMTMLAEQRPRLATVLDFERMSQLDEILSWAEEAARYVETVIIIPKVNGGIARLPRAIGGKPVRLGYSVPTRYGGTTVPLAEFDGWPVHLLGGSPEKQMALYKFMSVRSVDTNYTHKMASEYCQYWVPGIAHHAKNRYWPTLRESDGGIDGDAIYEAFRRSCVNVMKAWRDVIAGPAAMGSEYVGDLPLFAAQKQPEQVLTVA